MNSRQAKGTRTRQKTPKGKIVPQMLDKEMAMERIADAVGPLTRLVALKNPIQTLRPKYLAACVYEELKGPDGRVDVGDIAQRLSELETEALNIFSEYLTNCANQFRVGQIKNDIVSLKGEPRALSLAAPHFEAACERLEEGILRRLESFPRVDNGFEHLGTRYGFSDAIVGLKTELERVDEIYKEYIGALDKIRAETGLPRENQDFVSKMEALQKRDIAKMVFARMDEAANRLFGEELKKLESLAQLSIAQLAREEEFSKELEKLSEYCRPSAQEHADRLVAMSEDCDSGMKALEAVSQIREKIRHIAEHLFNSHVFASLFYPIEDNLHIISDLRSRSGIKFTLQKMSFPEHFGKQGGAGSLPPGNKSEP